MVSPQLQVAVDVGCRRHRVAVGNVAGAVLEEFDVEHNAACLAEFFARIERLRAERGWPVAVAMEGYNGWARPLDRQVLLRGWRLYNVNNLKLARYKEIFPAPSRVMPLTRGACWSCFDCMGNCAWRVTCCKKWRPCRLRTTNSSASPAAAANW